MLTRTGIRGSRPSTLAWIQAASSNFSILSSGVREENNRKAKRWEVGR